MTDQIEPRGLNDLVYRQKSNELAEREKEFLSDYAELCRKHRLEMKPAMFFKPQIDGTFTLGTSLIVGDASG